MIAVSSSLKIADLPVERFSIDSAPSDNHAFEAHIARRIIEPLPATGSTHVGS